MSGERVVIVIRDLSGGGAERFVSEMLGDVSFSQTCCFILACEDTQPNRLTVNEFISGNVNAIFLPWRLSSFITEMWRLNATLSKSKFLTFLNSASGRVAVVKLLTFGKLNLIVCQRSHPIECLAVESVLQKLRHLVVYLFVFNVANNIICNSRGALNAVRKLTLFTGKSCYLDSWLVPKQLLSTLNTKRKVCSQRYYCCVGSLTKIKRVEYVIESFLRSDLSDDVKLKIVGDGPLRNELEKFVNQKDQMSRVEFLGWQRNPFLIMRSALGLIHGSVTEGCSNVISEALALGTPVIVHSAIREKFSDPFNGTVTYYDSGANTLEEVLNSHASISKEPRLQLINNYRKETSKKFLKFIGDF